MAPLPVITTRSTDMAAIPAAVDRAWVTESKAAVRAAESQRVRQRDPHLAFAGRIPHDVDVAVRIELAEVGIDRQRAVMDRQRAHGSLDRAGGRDQVSGHALGGTDRDLAPILTEHN